MAQIPLTHLLFIFLQSDSLPLTLSAAFSHTHPCYRHLLNPEKTVWRVIITNKDYAKLDSAVMEHDRCINLACFRVKNMQWSGFRIKGSGVLLRGSHLFYLFFSPVIVNPNVQFRSHEEEGAIHHPAALPSTALSWRYLGRELIIHGNSSVAGALISRWICPRYGCLAYGGKKKKLPCVCCSSCSGTK